MSFRLDDPKFLIGKFNLHNNGIEEVTGTEFEWTGTEAYRDNPYGKQVGDFTLSHLNITSLLSRFSALTEFSFSVLFKLDTLGSDRVMFSASDSGDASSEVKFGVSSTDKISFGARENGGGEFSLLSDETLITDKWYHAVGTVNSVATYLYIDGEFDKVGSGGAGFSVVPDLDFMAIGANTDSGGLQWYWDGGIGSMNLYNIVLTQDEAITLGEEMIR